MRNAISQQRLAQLIADNATLALFVMDAHQHCAFMNAAAEELTGFSRDEVLSAGKPLHDLVHHTYPDGRPFPIGECPIDRALPERARTRGEDVFIRKDGSRVPVAFTASPVLEDGLPVGTVLEVRDLTPEREAARALRERDERYEFLAENVPVQIWTALPDGRLDYVTRQTASHFGLSPEQVLREGWISVLHPDDVEPTVARWKQSLATGDRYELEFRLRMADGSYATHLARAVPQRDAGGAIVRWFGTNTNIEEQKEERRRIAALLEEVEAQAKESADAIVALRTERDGALARIAELDAERGR
jgi:PAS domain S-box-containing protein